MKKLHGTGVALVTPFTETLAVDYKALKRLLVHTAKGVDYYVVMGTTGESATCTDDEKSRVLEFIKANNTKNLPLVFGIGGNDTNHVIASIATTDFRGVDALLSVSPYYNKPSQEGIYQHFASIAKASPVPVILYNVPGRTSSNITAETTLRLADHPNIVGIKEASGNLEQCLRIMKHKPKDFLLISGDDLWSGALYAMGAKGVISVLANAFPLIFKKVKTNAFEDQHVKGSAELSRLLDINKLMYEEGNPVGVKYLLSQLKVCAPYVRQPLLTASGDLQHSIDAMLGQMKK